jgi:hypothetical protein
VPVLEERMKWILNRVKLTWKKLILKKDKLTWNPEYIWLLILTVFTLLLLVVTFDHTEDFTAGVVSFLSTMMGVGAGGLITFHLVDKEVKRRKDLNMLWYYKSILDASFIIASIINFYNEGGFKLLRFEDKYPFDQYQKKLIIAKMAERSLNHGVYIGKMLKELCGSLRYMNQRMTFRMIIWQWGTLRGFDEMNDLSRSTLNNLYPVFMEFISEVLNPALKDVDDIEIRNAIFACKENSNAFVMMYNYNKVKLGLEFNQNILSFCVNFIRLYELINKKLNLISVDVKVTYEDKIGIKSLK